MVFVDIDKDYNNLSIYEENPQYLRGPTALISGATVFVDIDKDYNLSIYEESSQYP